MRGRIECGEEVKEMARKKPVIKTISYVHSKEDGHLIPFEELTLEQKRKAATELKLRMLRAMFPGVEFFVVPGEAREEGA